MIIVITGTPGAGKTYHAVRMVQREVTQGRRIYTNLPLVPACPYYGSVERIRGWGDVLSLPACEDGVGLVVIDEGQEGLASWVLSRKDRTQVLEWVMRSRHYGYDVWVITQHSLHMDAIVRRVADFELRVANPRKLRGFAWVPGYIVVTYVGGVEVSTEVYSWDRRIYAWYDSYSLAVETAARRLGRVEGEKKSVVCV